MSVQSLRSVERGSPGSPAHQVVEDRARNDAEAVRVEGGADAINVERHVAVGAKLQSAKARRCGFIENALPWRQVRVLHVVHPQQQGAQVIVIGLLISASALTVSNRKDRCFGSWKAMKALVCS